MAKFKVGQKVKLVDDVKAGTAGAFTLYRGTVGTVGEVQSVLGKEYMVNFPEGSFYVSKDKIAANSCASTNPVVQNALAAQGVARNAEGDDYQAIANETRKVLSHLKSADDITVANVMKSIKNNGELANKSNEMWKHISEARKLANYIIQYNG